MNLIEVQDDLRSLPNDPRTMQMLTAYANGSNPEVPPYVALGELNRRKQLMERAQAQAAGQPPQQSIKDQMTQSAGIMALQGGRQQQAQQQMMQQMAQRQQIPPQVQQQGPVQAARGGLLSRLMGYPTARYRSGGIVSFQSGTEGTVGTEEDRQNEEEERRREELIRRMSEAQDVAYGGDEEAYLRKLMNEAAQFRGTRPQKADFDPIAMRKAAIAADPSLAAADKDTGAESLRRLDELQALRRAEFEKQREENLRNRPGLFAQLAAGAAQSRGGDRLAAMLGGYAQVARKQREMETEQERGLRAKEIELQQTRAAAQDKLEEAQRARAEGRIDDYRKAMLEYQKITKDYDVASASLLRGEIAAEQSAATRRQVANIQAQARRDTEATRAAKPGRVTDFQSDVDARFQKIKADNPEMSDVDARARAVAEARAAIQTPQTAGVEQRTIAEANKALDAIRYTKAFREFAKGYASPLDAEQAYRELYRTNNLPAALRGSASGATPTPAKPATPASSAAPTGGAVTVTAGGRTYSFPNQQAADDFKKAAGIK